MSQLPTDTLECSIHLRTKAKTPRPNTGPSRAEAVTLDISAATSWSCSLPGNLAGGQAAVEGGAGAAAGSRPQGLIHFTALSLWEILFPSARD